MYFDIKKGRVIDQQKDVVSSKKWVDGITKKYSAALHEEGFLIFLDPLLIHDNDEYNVGDPYAVASNLESSFQKRRFQSTLHLLESVNGVASARILDIGCGEGHITNAIKKEYPSAKVYGLDYSVSAIRYAHGHFPEVDFVVADAYCPPYRDNSFDVIILNNIWEHVPDPLRLLSSISRVLNSGGSIIISTPSRYRFSNIIKIIRGKRVGFMSKLHVTEYSVGQMMELLAFGGYNVEMIYSKKINDGGIVYRTAKTIIRFFLNFVNSHHMLESTLFYLAKKK